jgi:hypothetical protein
MTVVDLIAAAHQLRVSDIPGYGFLVDDKPADTRTAIRLADLVNDGLLERSSDLKHDAAYLAPTAAGLTRIGR